MSSDRPAGTREPAAAAPLEVRPIGGLQELRALLTEARARPQAANPGGGAALRLPEGALLRDLLRHADELQGARPTPWLRRLWRSLTGAEAAKRRATDDLLFTLAAALADEQLRVHSVLAAELAAARSRVADLEHRLAVADSPPARESSALESP